MVRARALADNTEAPFAQKMMKARRAFKSEFEDLDRRSKALSGEKLDKPTKPPIRDSEGSQDFLDFATS